MEVGLHHRSAAHAAAKFVFWSAFHVAIFSLQPERSVYNLSAVCAMTDAVLGLTCDSDLEYDSHLSSYAVLDCLGAD